MVLTGEDDGDMSYMRMQERQLKPGASNRRALPTSHNGQSDDSSLVVPSGPGHDSQQDYRSHLDQGNPRQYGRSNGSGRRGGFRPTYD